MNNWIIKYIWHCLALIAVQALVLSHINISGLVNPYIYPLLILFLPLTTPRWAMLLIAFAIGLSVDIFQSTLGMHASAAVLLAFIRPGLLRILNPKEQEMNELMDPYYHGITWFAIYAGILVFIHHLFYFAVEKGNFHEYWWTFLRSLCSTAFSLLTMTVYMVMVFSKSKKKY